LLFASGRLRTANTGARVLLGLADESLEQYTYEGIFPVADSPSARIDTQKGALTTISTTGSPAAGSSAAPSTRRKSPSLHGSSPYPDYSQSTSSVKAEGHLQPLTARVQSSQESLALKAAIYTSETDGSLRSVLIVDITPPEVSSKGPLRPRNGEEGDNESNASSSSLIPSIIKRHSGDIRRYFSGGHVQAQPSSPRPSQSPITEEQEEEDNNTEIGGLSHSYSKEPPPLGRRTTVVARPQERDSHTPRPSEYDTNVAEAQRNTSEPSFARTRPALAPKQKSTMSLRSQTKREASSRSGLAAPEPPSSGEQPPPMPRMGTNNSDQSSGGHTSSGLSGLSTRSKKRPSTLQLPLDGVDFSLAHSALAAHPRTGVIISRNDLSSGFINSRTRELLMGLKSPEGEKTSDPLDDMWFAPSAGKEKPVSEEPMIPSGSPLWEDDIVFEDGKVRIDLPDRGFNMQTSVSDILKWSLKRRKLRQHHRFVRDEASVSSGVSASPPPSLAGAAPSSTSGSMYNYRGGMTQTEAKALLDSLQSERPWLAHKPYKVYDTSFSQRTEDPFEKLFDQCIRKDETPASGSESITVGIETEVGPAEKCVFPENECFTYMAENTDPNKPDGLVPVRVRRRIVQARAAPLKDMNGDHVGGVVWLRDITGELGAATTPHAGPQPASNPLQSVPSIAAQTSAFLGMPMGEANAGSDPFWQQIINSMPQMVWVTKPDGQHIYFNNKWYSFTGLQPEQSLGVNWQNPFHPDDMPASRRHWSRSLATGEPYSVEYRCRRHDGVWRWQLGRAQALLDANGKIVAWFGTCTDVEEFVQMRTQLAETSQNLRRVIDLASITLCCVGKDLKVLFLEGGGALMHHGYEDYKSRLCDRYQV
jgi:PAS domain S-box-containing protein